ncbi:MAG: LysM peptidoglycan-binding domain-containing protein [Chloroflexi bacterium]|nr:LysM peptidoglycan-binding domain-containing protein [Chloroflexota bacterium]
MLLRLRLLPLLVVLLVVLTGCFRQAGEEFVAPGDTAPQTVPDQNAATEAATDESNMPVVTIISPPTATDTPAASTQPDSDTEPTEEAVDDTTPEATSPLEPTSSSLGSGEIVEPSATPTFLTPVNPMPITPAGPTPGVSPTPTPSGLITPTALAEGPTGDGCTYSVQPGNTLFSIARNNNITLEQLRQANPEIQGDLIQIGQVLNIPGCGQGLDDSGNPLQAPTPTAATNASGQTIHVVQAGQTLVSIARQYGVTVQAIVSANNIANPNVISAGQELIIPVSTPTP